MIGRYTHFNESFFFYVNETIFEIGFNDYIRLNILVMAYLD